MGKLLKASVAARVLVQRINRKLAREDKILRMTRASHDEESGPYYDQNLGRYFVVDVGRNCVADTHLDLEAFAREIGALAPWEVLA
jgi:hypothetical protein